MKRIAWLFLVVLGSVVFMHAQDSVNSMNTAKLSGTICNSACVTQVANLSTCDKECTDTSGKAVLVDDQGKVMKIADQDQAKCQSHMGKRVNMMATMPSEMQREQTLRIREIEASTP
jgi:hypothetical protein